MARYDAPFGYVISNAGMFSAFTPAGILIDRYSRLRAEAMHAEMTPAAELRVMLADLLGYDIITVQNLNAMSEADLYARVDEITAPA